MVTSAASVAAGIASLLLGAFALCFNVPRFIASEGRAGASRNDAHARHDGTGGFHATATIVDAGHGNKRLTVRLEFGPGQHDEDDAL